MKRKPSQPRICPCESGRLYPDCCQPYHLGDLPPNPLSLMRARYCAYSLNLPRFVMETTAPDNPGYKLNQKAWFRELRRYCSRTSFTGLTILSVSMGPHPDEGFVTFRATLSEQGRDRSFTEKSHFIRENGIWLYHSGDMSA